MATAPEPKLIAKSEIDQMLGDIRWALARAHRVTEQEAIGAANAMQSVCQSPEYAGYMKQWLDTVMGMAAGVKGQGDAVQMAMAVASATVTMGIYTGLLSVLRAPRIKLQ